jgi:uncharacterized membrane protein
MELVGAAIILGDYPGHGDVPPRRFAHKGLAIAYPGYRSDVGRGILLGLELLVGADIISTITAPLTFESVGLLAAIVAIRTFLSFSLETEIEGCWPWQRIVKDMAARSLAESDR